MSTITPEIFDTRFIQKDQPISIYPMYIQPDIEPHTHSFYELVVVTAGRGLHSSEVGEFEIVAGDVFLIYPEVTHCYKATSKLALYNIIYRPDILEHLVCDSKNVPGWDLLFSISSRSVPKKGLTDHLRLDSVGLAEVLSLLAKVQNEIEKASPGWQLAITLLFYETLLYICRKAERPNPLRPSPAVAIANVLAFIEKNFYKDIDISQLVQKANVSQPTLQRFFQEAKGTSPMKYLQHVRLEYAARLLQETDLSVTEISIKSGFNDPNYFARSFRAVYKISPKEYRTQMRKEMIRRKPE